eukprot:3885521-Pyramimonas_sp.AAC.1
MLQKSKNVVKAKNGHPCCSKTSGLMTVAPDYCAVRGRGQFCYWAIGEAWNARGSVRLANRAVIHLAICASPGCSLWW